MPKKKNRESILLEVKNYINSKLLQIGENPIHNRIVEICEKIYQYINSDIDCDGEDFYKKSLNTLNLLTKIIKLNEQNSNDNQHKNIESQDIYSAIPEFLKKLGIDGYKMCEEYCYEVIASIRIEQKMKFPNHDLYSNLPEIVAIQKNFDKLIDDGFYIEIVKELNKVKIDDRKS